MDSPLEGDGFEPSVPHKKQPFLVWGREVGFHDLFSNLGISLAAVLASS